MHRVNYRHFYLSEDDSDEDLATMRESMMSLLQQSDPRSDEEILSPQPQKTKKKTKKTAKKGKKVKKKKKVWSVLFKVVQFGRTIQSSGVCLQYL